MSGHTLAPFQAPASQRHIVLSTQYGYPMLQTRGNAVGMGGFAGAAGGVRQLWIPIGDDIDYNIYPGDLLFCVKQAAARRIKRGADGLSMISQQAFVVSSVNGIWCTETEWNKLRGWTDHEKKREFFKKNFTILGHSLKSHIYQGVKGVSLDDPVVLLGGTFHAYINWEKDVYPMDMLCWDVPDDSQRMPADRSDFATVTDTTRKLVLKPLRDAYTPITATNLQKHVLRTKPESAEVLTNDDAAKAYAAKTDKVNCAEKDALLAFVKLMHTVTTLTDNLTGGVDVGEVIRSFDRDCESIMRGGDKTVVDQKYAKFSHLILESVAVRQMVDNCIDAIKEPEREVRERIVSQALRGAQKGERTDILCYH